ncbi:nucleoside hydrolase [Mycolicibacterium arseniciresistens]|uniref:Nucleoside hydrolase n=1 Tax=Mycolicibacterium arseniciresistens TaxID=3062257 RepID=A0ABT8UB76_9MYCO|nr:nucleoside hydrolase [Mycolicibacterium arseniciresistens]MDO3634436.1 nucleoside hydrolase [Mycolicibacterium arseniciresistens]
MARPVILDVDTGIDDALALIFAHRRGDLDVRAITCVAGNTGVDQVVLNTCAVLDLLAAPDIPVAAGATRPLVEPPRDASWVHGAGGLADLALPPSARQPAALHAVEILRREILAAATPLTVVALGPLTNLALLIRTYPDVVNRIERIVFMGGSASTGNASPVAEYNIWHDPEAAAIMLNSGVPLTMYGLDVYRRVIADTALLGELKASTDPLQRAVGALLGFEVAAPTGETYANPLIGDAGAVCGLVAPELFEFETWPVQVEFARGLSRGQTLVDRRRTLGEDAVHDSRREPWPRIEMAMSCDAERVMALFKDALRPKD